MRDKVGVALEVTWLYKSDSLGMNQTFRSEEEGSGHLRTSELSPGWNVDLTNQNH